MKKKTWKDDPVIKQYLQPKNKGLFEWISLVSIVIIIVGALWVGLVYCTMLLWNWLMPIIFSLPTLSFWQTAGLMILITIIFSFIKPNKTSK